MRWLQTAALLTIPGLLGLVCWMSRPFAQPLIQLKQSVWTLSPAQQHNLQIAAAHLNSTILQPGERFSFNRVLGPRFRSRGYLPAPSYLGGESPETVGGGICLLSSLLYQEALKVGFRIEQRVPHLRTIHSVPPGLDATVWYGGADLRFTNTLPQPVRIQAELQDRQLLVALNGHRPIVPKALQRMVKQSAENKILVTVFQQDRMISRDLYRLSP
jgi:vancomycin resistance protein VanW